MCICVGCQSQWELTVNFDARSVNFASCCSNFERTACLCRKCKAWVWTSSLIFESRFSVLDTIMSIMKQQTNKNIANHILRDRSRLQYFWCQEDDRTFHSSAPIAVRMSMEVRKEASDSSIFVHKSICCETSCSCSWLFARKN